MKKLTLIISSVLAGSIFMGGLVLAAGFTHRGFGFGNMRNKADAVIVGTVSALNGNIFSVESKGFGPHATTTIYTVDASNAAITKNGASSTISAVSIGDKLMAQGTINGTNITVTTINDGAPMKPLPKPKRENYPVFAPSVPPLQGNGQPVIGGTVTEINNFVLTVATKTNIIYTVDASNATVIIKGNGNNSFSSLSSVKVGDNVVVQGAVNGTSVAASSIIDQAAPKNSTANNGNSVNYRAPQGLFNGVVNFFKHIFGFF